MFILHIIVIDHLNKIWNSFQISFHLTQGFLSQYYLRIDKIFFLIHLRWWILSWSLKYLHIVYVIPNVMRSNHQRIHWRFQLVRLLCLGLRSSKKLSMDFLKIHGLRWTSRGFVIIKRKPWLIWVIFKRGLLVEPRPLHKDWEKKTRFGQFDLLLLFWS